MASKNGNYETTLKLAYDREEQEWKIGPHRAIVSRTPVEDVNCISRLNGITITIINPGDSNCHMRYMASVDSMGMAEDGNPIFYEKFEDAYAQLEENMVNLERYLRAHVDISILKDQEPMRWESEEVGAHLIVEDLRKRALEEKIIREGLKPRESRDRISCEMMDGTETPIKLENNNGIEK
jgi:hypothetical protein